MDSTPADNPVFREQYDKYLKTVIDPSRAYSFEEFSKIDNLKKQYLADPKNFKFDTYASGRRTFPATMSSKTELPIAEKIKGVLSEAEKRTVKQLSSAVKSTPMETPYGKSFLSYTPEGKIAGKTGSVLRGLGKVAGPLGAALTALDLAQGLGEVQEKGAAKIAEDYKKSKMAESEAEILTPEADEFREGLKSKRTELEILRAELEQKREKEERYKKEAIQRMARQDRVRDTLEQTGLRP